MTEIEKLRALLAEAREFVECFSVAGGDSVASISSFKVDLPKDGFPRQWATMAAPDVLARIDAALAEPVQNYEALYRTNVRCECGDYDACLLTRQRDEARKYAKERNDEANKLQRFLNMAAQERDEARAEIERLKTESPSGDMKTDVAEQRQVFKRGAEAMRDAAWKHFACPPYDGCNNGDHHERCESCEAADRISELPIPEDK